MKTYTIHKGCHYSNFFPSIKLIDEKMVFEKRFRFDKSCKYEIDEPSCVNKLFGFCFGFGVHKESARFGWTYDKETNLIDIWKYMYRDGKLSKAPCIFFDLDETHTFTIVMERKPSDLSKYRWMYDVDFRMDGRLYGFDQIYSNKLFLTTLGPYFGGNSRAPHDILIEKT